MSENLIRNQIAAVLRRDISVSKLERWLDSEAREILLSADESAVDLMSSIHLLLSDYYDERIDENEFRRQLAELQNHQAVKSVHLSVDSARVRTVRAVRPFVSSTPSRLVSLPAR